MKTAQERFSLFLVGICILQILSYAPLMPEHMASHFNGEGVPNGWSPRTAFFGLYLGLLVILFLAFRVLPGLISHFPDSIINLPNKGYWLAPERRAATFHLIRERMMLMGNGVLIFCIATFHLVFKANLTDARRMSAEAMWLILAVLLIFIVAWTISFVRLFRIPPEKSS